MSSDVQSPPAADPPPPSAVKKHLPFVLALVGGLAAGGASGVFLVGPAMAKGITPAVMAAGAAHPKAAAHDAEGEADDAGGDADEESGGGEHDGKEDEKAGEKPVHTLDNLVLNPAESSGTRFLLLSITFEASKAAIVDEMKARDAELRDVVLVTLGSKTVEQLSDVKVRESMKQELVAAAGKLFKTKGIRRVYFPQFVIQ